MKLLQTDSGVVGITAWTAIKDRAAQRIMGALVCLVLSASGASAATLNVVGGELLGAFDVNVGGSLYNVEFLDGTCIALYNGCDSPSDFTFAILSDAVLASQALLDQVFLDGASGAFDSDPTLTNGCGPTTEDSCKALTPFDVAEGFPAFLEVVITTNGIEFDLSAGHGTPAPPSTDFSESPVFVYAVWSPVPEPGTAVLMGLGLLGLSVRNRREG